ncbi:uncharacterized protein M421DRAFT_223175 [Didymella exigua CBS 183.55]|uniref:Zinc knuckle-domain-containing protein n=1 Tax=Didymella exigua CBS 183.55 TaxID=1150837 RepID=A0A6A5RHU4_9PLEO|nr:uncharacterized protein M421DRAFT_223175 [Didymella exigua CBS 183.55]KAF1926026.1 hypothetical protein M421DRAFT_223175 [Didymella exigua CBS 183.55]
MFRRPGAGASKASPATQCQKCLQRGHYSYECKAKASERPYKARPSRTQQLLNPTLKPKLTTEVPGDLVRNKGTADDILKKKDEERARGQKRGRKRSRSSSRGPRSASFDSVSTISTDRARSRSRSPRPRFDSAPGRDARSPGREARSPGRDARPPGREAQPPVRDARPRFDDAPARDVLLPTRDSPPPARQPPPPRAAPRERSLSPFSKRVALTRSMNR